MLVRETERNFVVYPSWAELEAKWEDLPRLFADPLKSGFIEPNFDFRRFGYPEHMQPHELFDGAEGGGIVLWRGEPSRGRWLPLSILHGGANLREPNGVRGNLSLGSPHDPSVCFLEPYDDPILRLAAGKKPRIFDPGLSFEHADSAGDTVYWIVRHRRNKGKRRELAGLRQIADWARAFRVGVEQVTDVPAEVQAETAPWFTNPENESTWFTVSGLDNGLGYHFAVVVYIGNALKSLAGRAMGSMHLIAQIEGRPNFLHRWNRTYYEP